MNKVQRGYHLFGWWLSVLMLLFWNACCSLTSKCCCCLCCYLSLAISISLPLLLIMFLFLFRWCLSQNQQATGNKCMYVYTCTLCSVVAFHAFKAVKVASWVLIICQESHIDRKKTFMYVLLTNVCTHKYVCKCM